MALVPTMGALHQGHLSLVKRAAELGSVVVTIFVNPTQFGPQEDFGSYPRNLEQDLVLLRELPVAGVFAPEVGEIYGPGEETTIRPGHRARGLCGGSRPEHFAGVLTVVAKLFGLIQPDVAVFGRKDAQQCLVIGQMVEDLKMPIQLVDAPTLREDDGLAMSSRNRYLSAPQRKQALCLSRSLGAGRSALERGVRDRSQLQQTMLDILQEADRVDYAEVRQVPDLEENPLVSGRILLAVAAQVGPARLIDNLVLEVGDSSVGGNSKDDNSVRDSHLLGTGRQS